MYLQRPDRFWPPSDNHSVLRLTVGQVSGRELRSELLENRAVVTERPTCLDLPHACRPLARSPCRALGQNPRPKWQQLCGAPPKLLNRGNMRPFSAGTLGLRDSCGLRLGTWLRFWMLSGEAESKGRLSMLPTASCTRGSTAVEEHGRIMPGTMIFPPLALFSFELC